MDFDSPTGRLSIFLGYFVFMAFAAGLFIVYRQGWREHRLGLGGVGPGLAIAIGALLLLLLAVAVAVA